MLEARNLGGINRARRKKGQRRAPTKPIQDYLDLNLVIDQKWVTARPAVVNHILKILPLKPENLISPLL